jgi:hypothetical protein
MPPRLFDLEQGLDAGVVTPLPGSTSDGPSITIRPTSILTSGTSSLKNKVYVTLELEDREVSQKCTFASSILPDLDLDTAGGDST